MAPASPETLSRKQRTTLRDGRPSKLIDLLKDGPKTSFTTQVSGAGVRRRAPTQNWKNAFQIGQNAKFSGKPFIGKMFASMYDNKLTLPDESSWHPVRPIGNGSYGAAALFRREDELGNAEDFVVVKYTEYRKKEMIDGWDSDISQEAAIMMQLNELDNDGILFLREFRHFPNVNANVCFTEYCPNFDVEILRLTHRAMKRRIPDAFIWYLFYTLAKGLVAMEQGPFGAYAIPHDHIPGAFLLHRDIKPANTFLGYPSAPSQPLTQYAAGYVGAQLKYPHAKIADFGLSRITTLAEDDNIASNHGAGSPFWLPPEMRISKFDKNSSWYPFRGTCYDDAGNLIPQDQPLEDKGRHAYTPAGNVFVVGYMMYQLITLDEPEDLHSYLNDIMSGDDSPAPMNILNPGNVMERYPILHELEAELAAGLGLSDDDEKLRQELYGRRRMIRRWLETDQDPLLKEIVESCMQFLPEKRISAANLLEKLEWLLPSQLQTLRGMGPDDFDQATKIFTTEADLPHMAPGNLDVESDARFWRRIMKAYKWVDVTAGNIRPPINPDDDRIPEEAKDMFCPGRKEEQNKRMAEAVSLRNNMLRRGPAPGPRVPVAPPRGARPAPDNGDDSLGLGPGPRNPKRRRVGP